MSDSTHKHIILYAEDDPDDLFMVQQAFEKYDSATNLVHASNGFNALKYLNQLYTSGSLPCLIILDINMPGMDGKETLIRIRQSEIYKDVPVVVFTTSSSEADKAFAQKWNADFITKPLVYLELEELAKGFASRCADEVAKRA